MAISTIAARGAISIIQASRVKLGEFKPRTTASININNTLNLAGAKAQQQQIISIALRRLEGIRQDVIAPNEEWEKTAAFLSFSGQPFKLTLDDGGSIVIDAQVESKLVEYSIAQRGQIQRGIESLNDVFANVDKASTKEGLRTKLDYAIVRVANMRLHFPAKDKWEHDFKFQEILGNPVKIQLNSNGDLIAENQLNSDFSNYEGGDRIKMQQAASKLKSIMKGDAVATELWQHTAMAYRQSKDDYFLSLDDSGNIKILQNKKIDDVTPDFLKASDDDKVTSPIKWIQDAINLYEQEKSFFLDFDPSGQNLVVRENNFINVTGQYDPIRTAFDISAAQLSILA
jgi:hypothetical protein